MGHDTPEASTDNATSTSMKDVQSDTLITPECQKLKICGAKSKSIDGLLNATKDEIWPSIPVKRKCHKVKFDGSWTNENTTQYWAKSGQKLSDYDAQIEVWMKDPASDDSTEREEEPPREEFALEGTSMEELAIEEKESDGDEDKRCDDHEPLKYRYRLAWWKENGKTIIAAVHEDDAATIKDIQATWGVYRYDDGGFFTLCDAKEDVYRNDRLRLMVDASGDVAMIPTGDNSGYFRNPYTLLEFITVT